jgi:hypothetical protein
LFAELRRKVKKKSCWIEFAGMATFKNERDVPGVTGLD